MQYPPSIILIRIKIQCIIYDWLLDQPKNMKVGSIEAKSGAKINFFTDMKFLLVQFIGGSLNSVVFQGGTFYGSQQPRE